MIDDGSINLKAGDVVNASLALSTTFEDASRMLGMNVTPENVAQRREEILTAMRERNDDPTVSKSDRAFLRHALAINEEVMKLQERGISVVSAGGNDGPNVFNIGFLAADRQYSAVDRDGNPSDYSARSSLTVDGRGDIDFKLYPVNALDPTPLAQQDSTYRLDGTNIYLNAREFGGSLQTTQLDMEANPLRFKNVEVPLTSANEESWISGSVTMEERGTSFVNISRLPADYPPEASDSDKRD